MRVGELARAEVREPEQREHLGVVRLELERAVKRLLRVVELALLEQLAPAHDRLVQGFAIARGSDH